MKLDLTQIPEVSSSSAQALVEKSEHIQGPFKRTPIFGQNTTSSEDMYRFEWPSAKELQDMSIDEDMESKISKVSYKESFGCLRAISVSFVNNMETPVFDGGRPDRIPMTEEYFDYEKPVSSIQVRIFKEKG